LAIKETLQVLVDTKVILITQIAGKMKSLFDRFILYKFYKKSRFITVTLVILKKITKKIFLGPEKFLKKLPNP